MEFDSPQSRTRGASTWSFTATSISVLKSEHTATKCYTTSANPDLWKKGGRRLNG